MKRTPITETITYMEPDSMSNFQACAGIMVSAPVKILLDANMGASDTLKLLGSEPPDMAFISHYHLDHAVWGGMVIENTNAELFVPKKEKEYLKTADSLIEKTAGSYGLTREWGDFVINVSKFRGFSDFSVYDPGEIFFKGRNAIQSVATPGHSPGHASFYFPKDRILFTGDMGIDAFGPWYGWDDCDLGDFTESILKLQSLDVELLLTSHGGIFKSDIENIWSKALGIILERERSIERRLENGKTGKEIIEEGIFFKNKSKMSNPMRLFLYMWDSNMLEHHLRILKQGGLCGLFPKLNSLEF